MRLALPDSFTHPRRILCTGLEGVRIVKDDRVVVDLVRVVKLEVVEDAFRRLPPERPRMPRAAVELDERVRRDAEDAHARGVRRRRHAVGADRGRVHGQVKPCLPSKPTRSASFSADQFSPSGAMPTRSPNGAKFSRVAVLASFAVSPTAAASTTRRRRAASFR